MTIYVLNVIFDKVDLLDGLIKKDSAAITKSTSDLSTLKFTAVNVDDMRYNYIQQGKVLEVDNEWYIIRSVKEQNDVKEVSCIQYAYKLKKMMWDNTFKIINPTAWVSGIFCAINCFYLYDNKYYICIESHQSGDVFETTKFNDVTGQLSNYMPATTCQNALDILFSVQDLFEVETDIETITDITLEKNTLEYNLNIIADTFGAEVVYNKNKIKLLQKAGVTKNIDLAKNRTQIYKTTDTDNVVNRLLLLGKNQLTVEVINNGCKYIEDTDSINQYGVLEGEYQNNSIEDTDYLLERGYKELESSAQPKISYSITSLIDADIDVFDEVRVFHKLVNESYLRVQSIEYNPFLPKLKTFVLVNVFNSKNIIKDIINKVNDAKDVLTDQIESIDTNQVVNKVIDVVKMETVSVENAHVMNAWIKNLFVDRLETNIWGKDVRNITLSSSSGSTYTRKYIVAEDQNIYFMCETLDRSTVVPLQIINPHTMLPGDLINVYYTEIGDGEDAYKYYTITKPHVLNSSITEEQDALYEVKVYKTISRSVKGQIGFDDKGNLNPRLSFGDDPTYGSFIVEKTAEQVSITWNNNSLIIEPEGIKVVNANPGSNGGYLSNVLYGSSEPLDSVGQNGDIYIVLEE